MMTAHQSILMRRHLPEVETVLVRDDRDILDIWAVRLGVSDGSVIVLTVRHGETQARRSRPVGDYSDRIELLPIEPDLRERLVLVFGPLRFGEEGC